MVPGAQKKSVRQRVVERARKQGIKTRAPILVKNNFSLIGNCVFIHLTQGKRVVIDLKDWWKVAHFKWCAWKGRKTWYARTTLPCGRAEYLHKLLFIGKEIDHRDGNGLNNRVSNLRSATPSQNGINRGRPSNNTSGFKGVSWGKRDKRWEARIQIRGKQKFLGSYNLIEDAAKAYDKSAKKNFGKFARLNFLQTKACSSADLP